MADTDEPLVKLPLYIGTREKVAAREREGESAARGKEWQEGKERVAKGGRVARGYCDVSKRFCDHFTDHQGLQS